ncbi:hypothetical protein OHA61_22125 [Streptomyces sp. NBC_00885]|uniref:hypothetical protein n=1 Tax=Streptomyces sp. NBC_00885 TaxID=2975857 RepID=UPI00386397AC|nr:hypothetical protein OHA61_22125 [Streptomyces sp. NBC_00885]
MRSDEQLQVMRAACASTDSFVNAARLGAATGLDPKKCGLVPTFMFKTGLLEPAGGHFSRFQPTKKARAIAAAWEKGEEEGLHALRSAWKGQWFARAMRERLGYGPVPRDGLVARLLMNANAERHRMRQAELLLDLLVAIGMVVSDGDGFMSWHEGPCYGPAEQPGEGREAQLSLEPDPEIGLSKRSPAVLTGDERPHPALQTAAHTPSSGEGAEAANASIPRPRRRVADDARTESDADPYADLDLLALLCPPVLLADLVRLSRDELLQLHEHLRGIAVLTAKLRGRPVS